MLTIKKIIGVYFSATGNTEKIVVDTGKYLAKSLGVPFESDDFTKPADHVEARNFSEGDLVIFGTPTYAGRIPHKILPFVQTLFHGNGAFALPLVTFGNRSFDNSLVELADELKKNDFHILAAGACACKHAFAEIGLNRPNGDDEKHREAFCATVVDKTFTAALPLAEVEIKGNADLTGYYVPLGMDGQPAKFLKAKPVTDEEKCDNCGTCADLCPMGSIDKADPSNVPGICIKCHSCVTHCHTGAKSFTDPAFLSHKAMLEQNHTAPAVSEFFL